jgi:adenylate cyclase
MSANSIDCTALREPFDLNERCVKPGANEIDGQRIEPKAMDVLVCLADAAPNVVSPTTLLDRVWPGVVVGDNVVHQAIAQLRKALSDDRHSPRYIENIPRRGYRLVATVQRASALTPLPSRSLAVLPFVDLSPSRDQQFFADGVAEEILTALSASQLLTVIARGSSFAFRDQNADVETIARRLNVGHVLEGSVRLAGSRLRVDVRLVETVSAVQRWAQVYDGQLDDIFAVQAEIARNVATRLEATLGVSDAGLSATGATENVLPATGDRWRVNS